MGRRRKGAPPPYLFDRSTGQAYATLAGEKTYFGVHGSPESRRRYERFLRDWERTHGGTVTARARDDGTLRCAVPVYLAEVRPKLSPTEYHDTEYTLEALLKMFGPLHPDDFQPQDYKALRASWVATGLKRQTVNKQLGRVKRFFRWCVGEQRARPETHAMLLAVLPLAQGEAPDVEEVQPVPLRDYFRTLRQLGRHVRAMCRVQFYAGPRPGEVCRMRGSEIIQAGTVRLGKRLVKVPSGVWLFVPTRHKKAKSGKPTVYVIGPRAQAVLRPFLRDDPEAYLFQPGESRAEWEAAKRAARKSDVQPSQQDRSKRRPLLCPGPCYSVSSYGRAIERAAIRAGVADPPDAKNRRPAWNPHALRHSFAIRSELRSDLLTTSALLSHESPNVTLLYLQRKLDSAAGVARQFG